MAHDGWIDSAQLKFWTGPFKDVSKEVIRGLKHLVVSSVGERMKVFNQDHIVFIAFRDKKPVGMAMIAPFSAMRHFADETKEKPQAYLYNFICHPKYRGLKASVSLIYRVKDHVRESKEFGTANINADIRIIDAAAERFFRRNGFIKVCDWQSPTEIDYKGFTFFQARNELTLSHSDA